MLNLFLEIITFFDLAAAMMGDGQDPNVPFDSALCQAAFIQQHQHPHLPTTNGTPPVAAGAGAIDTPTRPIPPSSGSTPPSSSGASTSKVDK